VASIIDKNRSNRGTFKRLFAILGVGTAAAIAVAIFNVRSERSVQPPPRPEPLSKMSAKRLQLHSADNGVMGGARAAEQTMTVSITTTTDRAPSITPDPINDSTTSARFARIRSETPHKTKDKAMSDALEVARQKIVDHLKQLDPPVVAAPTIDDVRHKYLKPESVVEVLPTENVKAAWVESKLEPNRMWVEIDVEVTDDHVRELRAKDRFGSIGWVAAGAFVLLTALFGFLRVDAWTRGYLTTILAVVAAGLAGGGLALLAFAR